MWFVWLDDIRGTVVQLMRRESRPTDFSCLDDVTEKCRTSHGFVAIDGMIPQGFLLRDNDNKIHTLFTFSHATRKQLFVHLLQNHLDRSTSQHVEPVEFAVEDGYNENMLKWFHAAKAQLLQQVHSENF
jgi:hypothetical protein